jgi:hypothetical protein
MRCRPYSVEMATTLVLTHGPLAPILAPSGFVVSGPRALTFKTCFRLCGKGFGVGDSRFSRAVGADLAV